MGDFLSVSVMTRRLWRRRNCEDLSSHVAAPLKGEICCGGVRQRPAQRLPAFIDTLESPRENKGQICLGDFGKETY